MAPRKNFRNQAKKEVKPAAVVNKNGVKAEATVAASGGGFSGTKIFTWFMVLALLGVWSSVAVVWFDLVDYDNVIAERAKEFRFNFSEVLQGKLSAYDADGDGDFDVEDAKVLLGLKERPVSVLLREAKEESAVKEPDAVPPPDDDAAVPLPPISDDFIPDDSRDEATHPYEDENNAIDTKGELVEKAQPQQTVEESKQYNDQPGSLETKETVQLRYNAEAESVPEPEADVEPEVESVPELKENAEDQPKDKLQEKPKKKKPKLLNKFEKTIKMEIDAAEKLRKKGKVEEAVRAFETLVLQYPQSPRCRYGKALAEDGLAEKMLSNDMLQKAIGTYKEASELPNATPDLIKATLKKRAERQQFLGRMRGALATLEKLVQIFPEDVALKNDLGVAHLLIGDNKGAKRIYEEVLATAPSDGFAKVHYGFILKSENKIAESIPFLRDGLESGHPGTDDGRFYFHLGDALQRMGDDSAYKWYERGHLRGHFASVWQRSLYNVDGLKAQPWWTPKDTGYMDLVKTLERNWRIIRDEAQSVMDKTTGLFVPEEENLREKGEWGQFTLWQQGKKAGEACRSVPKTCGLLERYPEATGCKRGQIKFSVMQPGTHVWPHTGPTNCRLRMHLGLVIPKTGCKIRCTNDTRAWEEGKVLIFDDSFEHEVWQDADSYRLIFIVDVWHPELTQYQRQTLSSI
ncbi:aspartyl/asparaginyl beta-hydroxylase isoform X4 [Salmo salar]|uniref:Aspartyl/asparaginyl beta-hydroxylase isoform X4 n=1 Tax=Salmo salar TaxID=8030 RepID=A0A1S3NIM5_SALSA|nr:aspartyl/asparaginyl beta-hydroxylase-like isoform X4 [Salmo salar]|eukprot:XP_014015105.1 PREDICTED: aspartyl/asparaginyl beta-hydroxylase-like isoform X4 [Salmo salar]